MLIACHQLSTLSLAGKAKAISKLSTVQIERQRQAKTGTMDVPENLIADLTTNSIKINQNTVKSSKGEICEATDPKTITPCNTNDLQKVEAIRPVGFGPTTYGLEIRCSIQLSYGRKFLFYKHL